MHKLLALSLTAAAFTGLAFTAQGTPAPAPGRTITAQMSGYATGETRSIDSPDGQVDANCFDVALIDVATGDVVGTGTDCLYDIQPDGDGVMLKNVSFLNFPQGSVVVAGGVGVQPTSLPLYQATHITGSIPAPGTPNVMGGTGRFRGITGTSRLSGAVDMSDLGNNVIGFNCLFVVELD